MKLNNIPFGTTDWNLVPLVRKAGETGWSESRTCHFGDVRVRMVRYSAGYKADHWCSKGHILLCLEGQLLTELQDGRSFTLTPGISYQVADEAEAHRSRTQEGALLFIVD